MKLMLEKRYQMLPKIPNIKLVRLIFMKIESLIIIRIIYVILLKHF
jgi:hypothetical protein